MSEEVEKVGEIHNVPPDDKVPPDKEKEKTFPKRERKNIDHLVDPEFARKVLLHSEDSELAVINHGIVKKFLHQRIGRPDNLQRLNTGDILVITNNAEQTKTLLDLSTFCGVDVEVTTPAKWNSCKGTISGKGLRL